ncbi:hypothetical protein BGX28_002980, partial [Mortierella sp. GBA30]
NPSTTEALAGRHSRPSPNSGVNHRKNMAESLVASLKRLGTGYIDILYVQLWEYRIPIQEVMRALDDVVLAGKAPNVAVSDTPSWVVSSANTMADLRSLTPFTGFQTRYNLLSRSLESDIQPTCRYRPWYRALVNPRRRLPFGKASRDQKDSSNRHQGMVQTHFKDDQNWQILNEVKSIAKECNRKPAQVAINWILQKPGITSPLIGARTLEQLEDNLGTLEFTLSIEQMTRLDLVCNPKE